MTNTKCSPDWRFGICGSLAIGLALGLALSNIALGIALSVSFGVALPFARGIQKTETETSADPHA
ncbi:hypothetical protein [Nonomuraea sp. NPDC049309]|uniref:hypothetical protein n=1 Tax=Nonomuraea sp. NPDC049309 TaxID=3364350 RepID=UPI0037216FFB